MIANERAHTPGTPYVFFNKHTGVPVAIMSAGDYSTIVRNAGEDYVFVAALDTTDWHLWRLVDINTLEFTRGEQNNG